MITTERHNDFENPDETEDFRRRAEIFKELHGDRASLDIDMARLQAIDRSRKLAEPQYGEQDHGIMERDRDPSQNTSWVSVGPSNVNGRIKSLAVHPADGETIYAGAADGGVWRSVDGGRTWVSLMRLELSMAIGALAVAPSNPEVIYAATGEDTPGYSHSYPGVGVYKTTSTGRDWDLTGPIRSTRCTRVLMHPADPNIVYVAGNGGLDKSADGGKTWKLLLNAHVSDALMDPLAPQTVYAAIWNDGVYRSTDGGANWRQLSDGIPTGSTANWIKLAMGRNGTYGTHFLLAKMGLASALIFKSTDAGARWHQLPGTHGGAPYNTWTNMIAVDPENHQIIFAGGIALSRSNDGGACFTPISGTHADHQQLIFAPNDSRVCYLATDGGVYRSEDSGISWELESTELVAAQLYSIGVSQTNPLLVGSATQDQGIIKTNGSSVWVNTNAGNEGGVFVVDPSSSTNLYCNPNSSNLLRSTDGGNTWCTIQQGLGDPVPLVLDLAVKPGSSNLLLCVAGPSVFRSDNQGEMWHEVIQPFSPPRQVSFSPSHPEIVYLATSQGGIFRNEDSGAPDGWKEPYTTANAPPQGMIYALAVAWDDPNILYIGYSGYGAPKIFKSRDSGAHWSDAGGVLGTEALPDLPIASLAVDPDNPDVVFAATSIGVFRTLDAGRVWHRFDRGMPRIVTTQLVLRRCDRTLYCSTFGRGAYRRMI